MSIEQLSKLRKDQQNNKKSVISTRSRRRLKNLIRNKFQTCYIFALSRFENMFGIELWGHGLPDDQLTDIQKVNKKRWHQIRKDILDKGNLLSRSVDKELDLHDITFTGYLMELMVKEQNGK